MTHVFDGETYLEGHPDSKKKITGLEVPQWSKAVQIAKDTASLFPLNYLGVDIVFDKNLGPMVMEINVRPGLGIQLANKQSLLTLTDSINEIK